MFKSCSHEETWFQLATVWATKLLFERRHEAWPGAAPRPPGIGARNTFPSSFLPYILDAKEDRRFF